MSDHSEQELPQFRERQPPPHKQSRVRSVRAYVDFRPGIDFVVRRGDRCFIVDSWHQYADIEVISDKLSPEQIEWYRSLTGKHRENMALATWGTCLLSWEGKMERLAAMGVKIAYTFTAAW